MNWYKKIVLALLAIMLAHSLDARWRGRGYRSGWRRPGWRRGPVVWGGPGWFGPGYGFGGFYGPGFGYGYGFTPGLCRDNPGACAVGAIGTAIGTGLAFGNRW